MPSNKIIFFLCMYKMVDISVITWNQAEVAAANIHEDHDVNKTILLIICISDASKRWGGKNLYDLIDQGIKGKYGFKRMSELTKPQRQVKNI